MSLGSGICGKFYNSLYIKKAVKVSFFLHGHLQAVGPDLVYPRPIPTFRSDSGQTFDYNNKNKTFCNICIIQNGIPVKSTRSLHEPLCQCLAGYA